LAIKKKIKGIDQNKREGRGRMWRENEWRKK